MIIVAYFLLKRAPILIKRIWGNVNKLDYLNPFKILKLGIKTVLAILNDFYIIYYLAYGCVAIFGLLIHPFLFSIHLMDII